MIFASLHQHNLIILNKNNIIFYKIASVLILSIYIGLRDNVGGDWGTYYTNYFIGKININFFDYIKNFILTKDPLFHLINYIVVQTYPSYYFVNLIFATIFSLCLVSFSFSFNKPFFALTISTPVLITVVAMGFHRQALALGFFMVALTFLNKNEIFKYHFFVFVGCLFHYTAAFLFIFEVLSYKKFKISKLIIILLLLFLVVYLFIGFELIMITLGHYLNFYNSSGAFLRVFMCVIPSLIFLYFYRNYNFNFSHKILRGLSYFSLFLLLLLILSNSSAIIDRFAIYLIPLQIIIWINFIDLFEKKTNSNFFIFYIIILIYFLALIVWSFHGDYSIWWYPYKNIAYTYFLQLLN
ncbi:EpsG family protein [Alphaproteobacteria bacterium]|nr:EpsG family protein [Alphaproteobacteria bacterium]